MNEVKRFDGQMMLGGTAIPAGFKTGMVRGQDYDALQSRLDAAENFGNRMESERDLSRIELESVRQQLAERDAVLRELLDCPWVVEQATIPKAGIDAAPEQVVGTMHVSLMRLRKAIALLSSAEPVKPAGEQFYVTRPGEMLGGIALRQLGDESRWQEIAKLNEKPYPLMGPNDMYPVGTHLRMPAKGGDGEVS